MKKISLKQFQDHLLTTRQRLWLGAALALSLVLVYAAIISPWFEQRRQAEAIRSMAENYPRLIAGLEDETGLTLRIQSGCFKTQEKFSDGVSSCQLVTGTSAQEELPTNTERQARAYLAGNPSGFITDGTFTNGTGGFLLKLDESKQCKARHEGYLSIDCRVGFSKQNQDLIKELLNEQRLNEVKNSL